MNTILSTKYNRNPPSGLNFDDIFKMINISVTKINQISNTNKKQFDNFKKKMDQMTNSYV